MNAIETIGFPQDVLQILNETFDPQASAEVTDVFTKRLQFKFQNGYTLSMVNGLGTYGYEVAIWHEDNIGGWGWDDIQDETVEAYFNGDVRGYIETDIPAFAEMVRALYAYGMNQIEEQPHDPA